MDGFWQIAFFSEGVPEDWYDLTGIVIAAKGGRFAGVDPGGAYYRGVFVELPDDRIAFRVEVDISLANPEVYYSDKPASEGPQTFIREGEFRYLSAGAVPIVQSTLEMEAGRIVHLTGKRVAAK